MTAIQALSMDASAVDPTADAEVANRSYLDRQQLGFTGFPPDAAGFVGWTIDPFYAAAAPTAIASSRVNYIKIWIPRSATVTTMACVLQATGATSSGYAGMAIYSDGATTGTLLRSTTSSPTTFTSGTGYKTFTLTSSLAVTPGFYWLAWLFVGTTQPSLYAAGRAQNAAFFNGRAKRCGYINTSVTAFPSTFTIASLTDLGWNRFLGIY